jgi:cobalt-zinc-cadmium efflux system membrane fusion protein
MRVTHDFFIITSAAIVAVYFGQRACAHEGHAALPSTGVALDGNQLLISPPAIKAIGMETATIQLGDINHILQLNARVELHWSKQAKVTSLTDGRLEEVLVGPGDRVTQGQVLARIGSLESEKLQTELLQTAAERDTLTRLIEKREELAASGGIAGKVLLESKRQLRQKIAQHAIVRQKLRALGLDSEALRHVEESGETIALIPVASPINGTIEGSVARPGQLVQSTDHLFEIVDLSRLYLVGEVLEADAYLLDEGMPVVATFAGLPNQKFRGEIDLIDLEMDETKRLLRILVPVDNTERRLRPGMFGRMAIEVATAKQEILCPTSAVIDSGRGHYVLKRASEGKFTRQPVELGMRSPNWVAVKSGLFPGHQVITTAARLLAAMFDESPETASESETAGTPASKSKPHVRNSADPADWVLATKAVIELPPEHKGFATSLIEGRVSQIQVRPGQRVETGDVLAELESQELRDLQLELIQAASQLEWIRGEVERLQLLAKTGVTPARDLMERELEFAKLSERVAGLERRLKLIGMSKDIIEQLQAGDLTSLESEHALTGQTAVLSPLSGRIVNVDMALGEIVHSHDILFEIQNYETVWVKALVSEKDAPRIDVGQETMITVAANPALRLKGNVVRVAPMLTSRERVLPVWIEVENPDQFLREGMLARVEIKSPKQRETVPAQAQVAPSK